MIDLSESHGFQTRTEILGSDGPRRLVVAALSERINYSISEINQPINNAVTFAATAQSMRPRLML
jgi:hypothetical protein